MEYAPYTPPKRPVRFALAWAGLVIGIVAAAIGLSLATAGLVPFAVSTLGILLSTILWNVIRSAFPRSERWTGTAMTVATVVVWSALGLAIVIVGVFAIWSFTDIQPGLGPAIGLGSLMLIVWLAGAVVSYLSGAGQGRQRK